MHGHPEIMNTSSEPFSDAFQRLYCDPAVFATFSTFHPISFSRVLPFQPEDRVIDDAWVLGAETAHLADPNDLTRQQVTEAYARAGLLPETEAADLISVIDFFGPDFFELMGMLYANAGMFICALRWYREYLQIQEARPPEEGSGAEHEGAYASVGYSLYALGLFEEAIAWSKSCLGSQAIADVVCRALIEYEAQLQGGALRAVERAAGRTRFTIGASDPAQASQSSPRLKQAMKAVIPHGEFYLDWVRLDTPAPEIRPGDYPFRVERDAGERTRHKLNLIFATCARADDLVERGFSAEAKRLLGEAALWEPDAGCIQERLKSIR